MFRRKDICCSVDLMTPRKPQIIASISNVNVGGQVGENPTCIIPSIFYDKHGIVVDPKKGEFDKKQAETLLIRAEELSKKTGNPFFVDVMGITAEALVKYVAFIAEKTSVPFLVDSVSVEAKLEAFSYIAKAGLTKRAIYNSISYLSTSKELSALKDLGVQSAVVLAYDPKNIADGRANILAGNNMQPGPLAKAEQAGIQNVLVDTAVLNVPSIGETAAVIRDVKEKFGLPAGCAPANAISMWRRLKTGEFGVDARRICLGALSLYTQTFGADFVISGPIEYVDAVFPACSMGDAINAAEAERAERKIVSDHPLYRIF
jgi:tetrahydromethanopterin S-methyltransferase subunit H